jgi:hypothetical protein
MTEVRKSVGSMRTTTRIAELNEVQLVGKGERVYTRGYILI